MKLKPYFDTKERQERAIKECLEWVGTPYWHMVAVKGRGCDCSTLIGAVLYNIGILTKVEYTYYPKDWMLHTRKEIILDYIEKHSMYLKKGLVFVDVTHTIDSIDDLIVGDYIGFCYNKRGLTNHSGIYLGNRKYIHASFSGVVVLPVSPDWDRVRRIIRLEERID